MPVLVDPSLGTDGTISFAYRVSSEPRFDGLLFYIDDTIVMPLQSEVLSFKVRRISSHSFQMSECQTLFLSAIAFCH